MNRCFFFLLAGLLMPLATLAQPGWGAPASAALPVPLSPADSLLLAAARNDTLAAARLLARGADANQGAKTYLPVDGNNGISGQTTPLEVAIGRGHMVVARLLVQHRANVNQRGNYDLPLALAVSQSNRTYEDRTSNPGERSTF